jgi:hypothetical protein
MADDQDRRGMVLVPLCREPSLDSLHYTTQAMLTAVDDSDRCDRAVLLQPASDLIYEIDGRGGHHNAGIGFSRYG